MAIARYADIDFSTLISYSENESVFSTDTQKTPTSFPSSPRAHEKYPPGLTPPVVSIGSKKYCPKSSDTFCMSTSSDCCVNLRKRSICKTEPISEIILLPDLSML